MQKHKAKKSLGQNFLKSELALRKIVETGEVTKEDIILEIGPGKGALTERLLASAGQIIAVEKDRELVELLKIKFAKEIKTKKLKLIEEDILEYEVKEKNYKIIANIPYNITGAILKKFLGGPNQPERMVLMIQNEVAQRIIANDKKESLLSISIKAYAEPKMIMKVQARYFSPKPAVDSAVILIKNISKKLFLENKVSEEDFWSLVRAGFAHKRKKLSGNLKKLGEISLLKDIKDKRAENLSVTDWILLLKQL